MTRFRRTLITGLWAALGIALAGLGTPQADAGENPFHTLTALHKLAVASAKKPRHRHLAEANRLVHTMKAKPIYRVRKAAARRGLSSRQRTMLTALVRKMGRRARFDAARQREWKALFAAGRPGANVDVHSLIAYVLRESYLQNVRDLQIYANKVRHFNKQKAAVRARINALRKQVAKLAPKTPQLKPPPPPPQLRRLHLAQVDLQRRLNKTAKDSQLANVDLQNALQKQQQALQLMANISKAMNDIAMAAIRNLR